MRTFPQSALILSVAAALLVGCGGWQPPIAAPGDSLRLPLPSLDDTSMSPPALKTCATTPPQYEWIFKGACQKFDLTSTGGHFSLGEYQGITVKGSVGRTTAKGSVKIALADALDENGDIKQYKGEAFPRYKANPYYKHSVTYVYASAVNQSTQVIHPVTVQGKPVLQFTITNAKGFGDANACGMALLTFKLGWRAFPVSSKVKGKTVTITKPTVAKGIVLPPKIPLYFAVNCYKQ